MKIHSIILFCAAAAALCSAGCGKKEEVRKQEAPSAVGMAKLQEKLFRSVIRVHGNVQAKDKATLSSQTTGTISIMNVDDGYAVRKGDFLFQVDRENLENRVTAARQELKVAEENLKTAELNRQVAVTVFKKAEIDYNRATRLYASSAVSKDNLENAGVNYEKAKAELDKSEAVITFSKARVEQQRINLKIAEKDLTDSRIVSPFDGRVIRRLMRQGEYVKGGTEILYLENFSRLEISCLISALYYDALVPGKTHALVYSDGKPAAEGMLSYRSANVESLSRTFEIRMDLPHDTKLVSGTLCEVVLVLEERRGLGLPSDAVSLRKDGVMAAFAVTSEGRAKLVTVRPGITDGGLVEIMNAKEFAGQEFIVTGQNFINDGDRVVSMKKKAAPAAEGSAR